MKKLLFTLAGIAMTMGAAMAQDYQKNIFGVNAGLNLSSISGNYLEYAKTKAGFHVGVSYERLLMSNRPLYLETGLQYSMKGCAFNEYDGEKGHATASYLQIPVMVNYKFQLSDNFSLYPSLGLYYAVALGGNEVWKYEGEKESYPLFGKQGYFKRSDIGLRVSATAGYKRFTLSIGYEFGFINMIKPEGGDYDYDDYSLSRADYDYDYDYDIDIKPKAHTGNFFISVGYKF